MLGNFTIVSAVTFSLAASLLVTAAHADACDDECDSDRPNCSAEERCPESGVECEENFEDEASQCELDAIEQGLESRCSGNVELYCDPAEADPTADEGGCAIRRPQRSPSSAIALGTFAAAGIATAIRAARRRAR